MRSSGGLHRSFRGKIRVSDAENLISDNVYYALKANTGEVTAALLIFNMAALDR